MNQFVAQLRAFVIKNRYTLLVAGLTLVTVVASVRVAGPARKQKAALETESARLDAVIRSSALWMTQFQPASNEEAAIWQNTDAEVQTLGVKPTERLTVAQVVARRADEAGYGSAHLKFLPADAAASIPPRQVAGVTFNPAQYKLQITGAGGIGTLNAFLGGLPPAVQVQSVKLAGGGNGQVNTTVTLSVFEPAGTNVK